MKKPLLLRRQHIFPYADFVGNVNSFVWTQLTDAQLKAQLNWWDRSDFPKAYSLLKEIILRHTGLSLFDTQLAAAYCMQQGNIAELPTGEGKTLSAVLASACLALQGHHVHILEFNDYLANRNWNANQSIFDFCGLTSGCIQEQSSTKHRKETYACDIVYVSAKQAGFDYLKNFLCDAKEAFLPIDFDVAIVDEADSILIDEARIPLVVAGNWSLSRIEAGNAHAALQKLGPEDVVFSEKGEFWLTDTGIASLEKFFHLDNLYDESNADTLALISAAIEANRLLTRDKDYLIKNGEVLVIDETTGRIAASRKFPALLHQAVEIKEGLAESSETIIYNSMPLQFFLSQYDLLCGMTGTGKTSEVELKEMYGLQVHAIPPHLPCIRKDHDDCFFDTEAQKRSAVVTQIKICYEKGQPVLLGTPSVLESEKYSQLLRKASVPHKVLNARNDEMEAEIIANAGNPYEITISTNMAGRGVDIKLGGHGGKNKAFVCAAGGLFVIGSYMNRSVRIDRQLIGRAGRQGDPGESEFFISKEEPLIVQYVSEYKRVSKIPSKLVRYAQRDAESKDMEARYILGKYAYVLEVQRRRITAYRNDILTDCRRSHFLKSSDPESYSRWVEKAGEEGILLAEKQLTLYFINQHWADYLCTMENVRNGIHLNIIGGLNPIDEYHKIAVAAFSDMEEDIKKDVLSCLKRYQITKDGVNMRKAGLLGATSTCTYMIDESKTQFAKMPDLLAGLSNTMNGALFSLSDLLKRFYPFSK